MPPRAPGRVGPGRLAAKAGGAAASRKPSSARHVTELGPAARACQRWAAGSAWAQPEKAENGSERAGAGGPAKMAAAPHLPCRTPKPAEYPYPATPRLRPRRHSRPSSQRVPNAQARRGWAESEAGSVPSRGPSRETGWPEVSGDPAPRRNPRLLGNRCRRRRLALRSRERVKCSSRLLLWPPRVAPASLPAAALRPAESLPLALSPSLRLPRLLRAHLLQSQAPPKAGQPDPGHDLGAD